MSESWGIKENGKVVRIPDSLKYPVSFVSVRKGELKDVTACLKKDLEAYKKKQSRKGV